MFKIGARMQECGAVGGSVPCSRVSPQWWVLKVEESAGYSLP